MELQENTSPVKSPTLAPVSASFLLLSCCMKPHCFMMTSIWLLVQTMALLQTSNIT